MSEVREAGCQASSRDGQHLILRTTQIAAEVSGGLARVRLTQNFYNPHPEALHVVYRLPLPVRAAVSGFAFEIGERRVVGEVDRRARARERFEDALLAGQSAGLLDEERPDIFTQELGNLPAHTSLTAEIELDQMLDWQADGQWSWRFPTVIGPRFLGAAGRVHDADRITVDLRTNPDTLRSDSQTDDEQPRCQLELSIADPQLQAAQLRSPSHRILARRHDRGCTVEFDDVQGAGLDRDLVVRWPQTRTEYAPQIECARPPQTSNQRESAYGLLHIVPPRPMHAASSETRDGLTRELVVLLDTSGSMRGQPLAQAQRVTLALLDSLGPRDTLELIEFSTAARHFAPQAQPACKRLLQQARRWVKNLRAGGGTEMRTGILAALGQAHPESQRQVILITDGQIGFESEIIRAIGARQDQCLRVHTLGVGHAVNRTLTRGAARAGRGIEAIVAPSEDAQRCAERLVAHCKSPLLVDLELRGSALLDHSPQRLPDLLAEQPLQAFVRLRPEGGQLQIEARGPTGTWQHTLTVPATAPDQGNAAIVASYARSCVEDLELERAKGEAHTELDRRIENLGLEFQISTRLTSWVAIGTEVTVDPRRPTHHERVAQRLPAGLDRSLNQLRSHRSSTRTRAMPAEAAAMPEAMAMYSERSAPRGLAGASEQRSAPPAAPPSPSRRGRTTLRRRAAYRGGPPPSTGHLQLTIVGLTWRSTYCSVEVAVGADMHWQLQRVVFRLNDGQEITAQVDHERTTAPSSVTAGQHLRLTCLAPLPQASQVVAIEMHVEGFEPQSFSLPPQN